MCALILRYLVIWKLSFDSRCITLFSGYFMVFKKSATEALANTDYLVQQAAELQRQFAESKKLLAAKDKMGSKVLDNN
jgi:hypothetical protein